MKVLIRERISDAGLELLKEKFDVDVDGDGDLAEKIGAYDAIIIRSGTHLTKDLIERAENLKVIGRAGVGVDNVDVDAASRRGIVVANAPESTVVSAAEHTIGLLLALSRSIPQAHACLKAGTWDRSRFGGLELADKTLGLAGFGRIGQQVARRARGPRDERLAYDPYVAPGRFPSWASSAPNLWRICWPGRLPLPPPDARARDLSAHRPRAARGRQGRDPNRECGAR